MLVYNSLMKKPRTMKEFVTMGGKARMRSMTKKQRSEFARNAALSRHMKIKNKAHGKPQDVQ